MKKDDLISRAALFDEFRSLCGPQTGDGWDNMGVCNLIMQQKAVDAIPVEWLKAQNDSTEYYRTVQGQAVELILDLWQKEQEAKR